MGKATNLYQRIGAYIRERSLNFSDTRRPHIWRMINQWDGRLKYYFSTTENECDAKALEEEMINAFRPYFNRQYDAETSQVMRAF